MKPGNDSFDYVVSDISIDCGLSKKESCEFFNLLRTQIACAKAGVLSGFSGK